jgi:leader peptidase (prepilin peptidase)/N-methyltransferase
LTGVTNTTLDWLIVVAAAPFVGSFLGTLVLRLPERRPILLGRSTCAHCGHAVAALELIPLLSWLAQRGRCRHCGASLGAFYPAIELGAIAVALWAAMATAGFDLWASAALGWTLLALALIDARTFLLPDALTLPLLAAGLAVAALEDRAALLDHAIGAAAGFFVLAGIALVYRRWRRRDGMGLGDAKLLAALGAWVSWTGLPSVLLLAAASALAFALARAWFRGQRLAATDRLPFGPALCFAGWLVWLYGPLTLG